VKKSGGKKTYLTIEMSPDLKEGLRKKAEENHRSLSAELKVAVEMYTKWIPDPFSESRLAVLAKKQNTSVQEQLRRAIDFYVDSIDLAKE